MISIIQKLLSTSLKKGKYQTQEIVSTQENKPISSNANKSYKETSISSSKNTISDNQIQQARDIIAGDYNYNNIVIETHKSRIVSDYMLQLSELFCLIDRGDQDKDFNDLNPKMNCNYHGILIGRDKDKPRSYLNKKITKLNIWLNSNEGLARPNHIRFVPSSRECQKNNIKKTLEFKLKEECGIADFYAAVENLVKKFRYRHLVFSTVVNYETVIKNYKEFVDHYIDIWERVPCRKDGYSIVTILILEGAGKQGSEGEKIKSYFSKLKRENAAESVYYKYSNLTKIDRQHIIEWLELKEVQNIELIRYFSGKIESNLIQNTPMSMQKFISVFQKIFAEILEEVYPNEYKMKN